MNDNGIFIKSDGKLVLLRPTDYESEEVLQAALENHPEVIAGQSTDDEGGTRPLVLVAREIAIPSTLFKLDHLFIDDEAVPVLVEVKRASDTRIRRGVVAQMFDYAANAAENWPISYLRGLVETQAQNQKPDPVPVEKYLERVAGGDLEKFWKQVEANLAAGRIRMLFVADDLPDSLVRIIEFCNEQMSPAEVLGIEVRQYTAPGHTAYVPQVIGRTSEAVATKRSRTGTRWTSETFRTEIDTDRCTPAVRKIARRLLKHVDDHQGRFSWGTGVSPGVGGWYTIDGKDTPCWALSLGDGTPTSKPYLMFNFGDMIKYLSVDRVEKFADQLEPIPALKPRLDEARGNNWNKWPTLPLLEIADDPPLIEVLFAALDTLPTPTAAAAQDTNGTTSTADKE